MKKYDKESKKLLTNKELLWFLMKNYVDEYKDLSKKEILKCIEDGNLKKKYIEGINTEDLGIDDDYVAFDILFAAKLPNSNETVGLYINVESQNDFYPGYPIVKRAIYYATRLVARQKSINNDFSYKNIKKVYSIWICTNPSLIKENSINVYKFIEHNVFNNVKESINDYDLINVIIINLAKKDEKNISKLIKPLNMIFKGDDNIYMISTLKKDYNINISKKEVSNMWNMSSGLIEEGRIEGRIETSINAVNKLINKMNMTLDESLEFLEIDDELKEEIRKQLSKKIKNKNNKI